MYSEKIILRNLDEFAAREGWMPVPHTFDQVEEFKHYIDSLVKIDSNSRSSYVTLDRPITEKRRQEIWRWIENEQALCGLDSGYFESRYAYVCNEKGQIFKFHNRRSQEIFDAVIADFDEQEVSIELLVLKARQVGITTKTALKFLHRLLFIPHTQAVMASVQSDKSELIGRILDIAYNHCPWWLVPRRLPKGAFENGSVLSMQSGMQATGIAQGWTPTCIHVSELADIPKPEKVIEEGLLRATHSSKNLFLVFEGTGGGNTGWLANTWRSAKEDWPKGLSRLCPIFIPWPMATDLYPESDWIRKFPVPERFMEKRQDITRKHVLRCELFIRNAPYLAKIVGTQWKMPVEQQWFWEFNYLQACKNHTQKIWLAQMAADDHEALTGIHDTVFGPETMKEIEDRIYEIQGNTIRRKNPVEAYAITGDSIDEGFEVNESIIDEEKPRIRVSWESDRGQQYDWVLIPLLPVNEDVETDSFDKLLIYEEPQVGASYSCGIDTADGLGGEEEDRTVVSMTRNRYGDECDYQVAELTSNRINSAQVVGFAACMAAWYGENAKDAREVKFCVEQITRPGDTCQHQLKLMGFHWHHIPRRYDSKKIKDNSTKKQGWYSNVWSVPMLMTRFTEAVNGGWYRPSSKWLIEELKTLERHEAAGHASKMEHRSGQHDDRVRAAAQSYFTAHDFDILAERAQKRYALPAEKNPPLCKAVCSVNQVSVGKFDW
jgi:hypothetical protein